MTTLALIVGSVITGFLVLCAIAPDPSATWTLGHLAMAGLMVYLLIRELTRKDDAETAKVDRPEHRTP